MALRKNEKKEEVAARELPRRPTGRNKKKAPVDDHDNLQAPLTTRKPKKAASGRKLKTGGSQENGKRGSLLDQVSAIMDPGTRTGIAAGGKKRVNKENKAKRASIRQVDESEGADQPLSNRKTSKKKAEGRRTPPPPPPRSPPTAVATSKSPPKARASTKAKANRKSSPQRQPAPQALSTLNFLQDLEQANEDRKQLLQKKKKKKPLKKKLSASRKKDIQKEMAKRKEVKANRKEAGALYIDDDNIEEVGWFTVTVKENTGSTVDYQPIEEETQNSETKKKKGKKTLRSTVDYSRDYPFSTRQDMEEKPPGYSLHMVGIKRRQFHIDNLFTTRLLVPRVYDFDVNVVQEILDKKEDRWWIKSRLPLYREEEEEDWEEDEDEKGMEILTVYFGPNEIDQDPEQDDNSVIFSIASVESVHFSDDDENQDTYKGKLREKVEVMPGEFKMIRKEEESYEAIENGNYMSSLCLGCGVALVSVMDAREVACPTCGSITPLNGVCLHKPFGIATGIKRIKVEHMLVPRKSPFVASIESNVASSKGKSDVPQTIMTNNNAAEATTPAAAAPRSTGMDQRKMKSSGAAKAKPGTGLKKRTSSKASSPRKLEATDRKARGKVRPNKPATKPGAVRVAAR